MKEILKKYYDIEISEYKDYKEGIIFFVDGYYYLFVKCHYDEEYINQLVIICSQLQLKNIQLHEFIYNKEGKLLSDSFVLFRIHVFIDSTISFNDVLLFANVDCNAYKKNYIFMDKFWEDKIDYLEMQLSELSDNKLINNSFDYYVGIGEILIAYLRKNYDKSSIDLRLSHKCLNCLDSIEYYNPLNISFDLFYKDIASYIRLTKDEDLLMNMIERINEKDKGYFFVRMVFPFTYFYEISDILIDGKESDKLIDVINHVTEYENYLRTMEKVFGIYLFSWIKLY